MPNDMEGDCVRAPAVFRGVSPPPGGLCRPARTGRVVAATVVMATAAATAYPLVKGLAGPTAPLPGTAPAPPASGAPAPEPGRGPPRWWGGRTRSWRTSYRSAARSLARAGPPKRMPGEGDRVLLGRCGLIVRRGRRWLRAEPADVLVFAMAGARAAPVSAAGTGPAGIQREREAGPGARARREREAAPGAGPRRGAAAPRGAGAERELVAALAAWRRTMPRWRAAA